MNEGLIRYNFIIYHYHDYQEFVLFILANSTDPAETPRFAVSHLGLRYLYMFLFFACIQPVPQVRTLNLRLSTPQHDTLCMRAAKALVMLLDNAIRNKISCTGSYKPFFLNSDLNYRQ